MSASICLAARLRTRERRWAARAFLAFDGRYLSCIVSYCSDFPQFSSARCSTNVASSTESVSVGVRFKPPRTVRLEYSFEISKVNVKTDTMRKGKRELPHMVAFVVVVAVRISNKCGRTIWGFQHFSVTPSVSSVRLVNRGSNS